MTSPSVADLLAFESWPREQQEIARAALWHEREAMLEDVRAEGKEELRETITPLVDRAEQLCDKARTALATARDVSQPPELRQAKYVEAQNLLDRLVDAIRTVGRR